jgi:hypothetical protein
MLCRLNFVSFKGIWNHAIDMLSKNVYSQHVALYRKRVSVFEAGYCRFAYLNSVVLIYDQRLTIFDF